MKKNKVIVLEEKEILTHTISFRPIKKNKEVKTFLVSDTLYKKFRKIPKYRVSDYIRKLIDIENIVLEDDWAKELREQLEEYLK